LLLVGISAVTLIVSCGSLVRFTASWQVEYKLLAAQLYSLVSAPYLLKGFVLVIKFEVCFHIAKNLQNPGEVHPPNWYVRNQWIARSGSFLLTVWVIFAAIVFLPAGLVQDIEVLTRYQVVIGLMFVMAFLVYQTFERKL
jgi:hypothetical protein